ncbi:hypothetical protein SprV_0702458100 [Sparganum proliferum]
MTIQTVEEDASEDLPGDVQQGDATEGTAVSAEGRSSAFRRRTVDIFDCGEEVTPLVAVRVPLDLLSFTSSSGVLHLARSLLKLAATAVEGSTVGISGLIYVGFVHVVHLGEQTVVEPILVLTASVAEYGYRCSLDCVSQLTPSAIPGSVLDSGGGVGSGSGSC